MIIDMNIITYIFQFVNSFKKNRRILHKMVERAVFSGEILWQVG